MYLEDVRTGCADAAARGTVSAVVQGRLAAVVLEGGDDLLPVVSHVLQPVVRVQDAAISLRLQAVHGQPRVCALQQQTEQLRYEYVILT